ncbi:MAG: MOSC domain-containing protein [Gammaproteobacteria bacterium]|nr:MOSC domain-containing protein [Gammaproteobacteria bacterium]MDP2140114.1 MOSC domain-containing protein [Gammaproteobacteria bacterium]MDP2346328.1 MOSC domain-containing protein [Gammaproteobacteria bacterium]
MSIERIFVSTDQSGTQIECDSVELKAHKGIVGDRYFGKMRHPGQNITLVEAEEIEAFCSDTARSLDMTLTRRNIVTRGIRLNALVGKEFRIGNALLRGVELCEPCSKLAGSLATESLPAKEVVERWLHRAGLRADVVESGIITHGNPVTMKE